MTVERRLIGRARRRVGGRAKVTHSAFSAAAGNQRVYFAAARSVYRWAPGSDEVERLFVLDALPTCLAVSADERRALTAGGNTAVLWSLPEGSKLADLKHPLACGGAALLATGGGRVLSVCFDGVVRLWDAALPDDPGIELARHDGEVFTIAILADGRQIAINSGGITLFKLLRS